jgi:DNA polymerase-3 subunit delta'
MMKKYKKERNLKFINGKWHIDFTFNHERIRKLGGYTKEQAKKTLHKLRISLFNEKQGFKKPGEDDSFEKILVDKGYEAGKARVLSLIVCGNLKQALSLEWEEVQARRGQAWQLFLSLLSKENLAQFLRTFTSSQRSFFKEEWEELLEILSSFCRDLILVKENSQERLLMNPDYEEEIRKAEKQVSEKHLQELLAKIDYSMYGLQKNFNLSLLVSSFFLDFKDVEYV